VEFPPDLTDPQCIEVLKRCEDRHDAEIGINWEVIRIHADDLFPEDRAALAQANGGSI